MLDTGGDDRDERPFLTDTRRDRIHTMEETSAHNKLHSPKREGLREGRVGHMCKPSRPRDDVTSPVVCER